LSRIPLRIVQDPKKLVECTSCGQCCTYVGISINAPSRPRWATDILWYLYHENTYVYLDGAGEWSVHFETRCRNLGADNRCAVYHDRPQICRGFDNSTCEINQPNAGAISFRDPRHFLQWLAVKKPKVYARIDGKYVPPSLRPLAASKGAAARPARRVAGARG
jgi:uncharacterized protein